jgi:hypothetical protein
MSQVLADFVAKVCLRRSQIFRTVDAVFEYVGASSPGDKLTGDFGNEPTSISDRDLFRLLAGDERSKHARIQPFLCGPGSAAHHFVLRCARDTH